MIVQLNFHALDKDDGRNYLDSELYRFVFCKEIEAIIRVQETQLCDAGYELKGSMSFDHIYQELSYHYLGYRYLPETSSYYGSCEVANLNYDENRWQCFPMKCISVPIY